MSASPSEFLTFHKRLVVSGTLVRAARTRTCQVQRPFSSTIIKKADTGSGHIFSDKGTQQDTGPGNSTGASREHATTKAKKGGDHNIQTKSSAGGMSARANDEGGHATREKDDTNATAKAKKEHPEAPDTVIGMQDERGGKGL